MKEPLIIINNNSNNSKSLIAHLGSLKIPYYLSNHYTLTAKELNERVLQGYRTFIICGGDGALHRFINEVMKLPIIIRKEISIGIVPSGRANDLARYMGIPLEFNRALELAMKGKTKNIDLIKVNKNYVVTGGGLGLPTETIQEIDSLSKRIIGNLLKKRLGEFIYFLYTLKKFIFGYRGVEIKYDKMQSYEELMAIYFLNQPFIGKRFNLAPGAKNNDGYFEIKRIKKTNNIFTNLRVLSLGIKGRLSELPIVVEDKTKKIVIRTNKEIYFMGDGELFDQNNNFEISIVPKAIKVIC